MIKNLAGVILLLMFSTALADISALKWMAGCWGHDFNDTGSVEEWMAPAGGLMLGMNRTIRAGKVVAFEYLRIVEDEDGWTGLIALPSGQEKARFKLVSMSANEVVFENPEHDFPQRIIYRLDSEGNLHGRIEGTIDGAVRVADFPMTKTKCGNGSDVE